MEVDFILQSKDEEDKYMIHDSEYSIVHVYSEYFFEQGLLSEYELAQLHKLGDYLIAKEDVIIYLFGNLNDCYQRYLKELQKNEPKMNFETFRGLYSKYEWAFDSHNCQTKLYKINVEEDLEQVIASILAILKQIVELRSTF